MNRIKTLIADDEKGAHRVLENYVARIPDLELVYGAFHAMKAYEYLENHPVDVVLLDITMPEVDGFRFLRMIRKPPLVIFTTAHEKFAMESYEYEAVDYLKKPIRFERFEKAIDKLRHRLEKGIAAQGGADSLSLKIDGVMRQVPLTQILYIQSLGNYVKVFTRDKILLTQTTTRELEEKLPRSVFIRIHKSFIVNKPHVSELLEEELAIGNKRLPIGRTFKKYVREFL